MVVVSLRGSVMDDRPRESMQCLVYIKQGDFKLIWDRGIHEPVKVAS